VPRRLLDYYETPPSYVQPLLTLIGPMAGLSVYEPCVGQGHISRYLTAARTLLTRTCSSASARYNPVAKPSPWPRPALGKFLDWTITNPPFSDELEILRRALNCSRNVASSQAVVSGTDADARSSDGVPADRCDRAPEI
jgi:hypothetical protein